MGVNVVSLANGETIVDMTGANITPETVLAGYIGYGADGDPVVGTMKPTVQRTASVLLHRDRWVDGVQTVDVDFVTAEAMVFEGGEPRDQEYLDCGVWCSGQEDGRLTFSCIYEPYEDVYANIGLLLSGDLVISFAHGSVISLNNSSDRKLRGLTLYGKTTQDGTPTPDNPVELVSAGDGGSVGVTAAGKNLLNYEKWKSTPIVNGTAVYESNGVTLTATANDCYTQCFPASGFEVIKFPISEGETITLSWEETSNASGAVGIFPNGLTDGIAWADNASAKKRTYTATKGVTFVTFRFGVRQSGTTISYKNIQVERGSTATAYEPYKGQTLAVSTPNGLPGIPVTSGGNYTDENGQQWVCDEEDFGRGKYVQRVEKITIDAEYNQAITINSAGTTILVSLEKYALGEFTPCLCSACVATDDANDFANTTVAARTGHNGAYIYFKGFGSLEEFNTYCASKPISVIYVLATPIETDLTAEQLTAYAALHTNYPNTTIYNDAGAGMAVRYVVA